MEGGNMKERPFAKLRGKMSETGYSQERLAEAIGIAPTSLNLKLAGKREFTRIEIEMIFRLLKLENVQDYFFNQ